VQFEFGQYMVGTIEGTSFSKSPMQKLVFLYVYLFPCKIRTNVHDILGMKKLPTFIPHLASSLLEDLRLYKYEILPEVEDYSTNTSWSSCMFQHFWQGG